MNLVDLDTVQPMLMFFIGMCVGLVTIMTMIAIIELIVRNKHKKQNKNGKN